MSEELYRQAELQAIVDEIAARRRHPTNLYRSKRPTRWYMLTIPADLAERIERAATPEVIAEVKP